MHSQAHNDTSAFAESRLEAALLKVMDYCQSNQWAGYDPYDALNSGAFAALPFLNFRLPQLLLTQLLKRSPVNLRPLLRIPKTQNPKAIALFLSAFTKLSAMGFIDSRDLAELMIERLIALRSQGFPYWCWGYSFPWQTRTIAVPAHAPNLVCTTFVAGALLDAFDLWKDSRCLSMAASTANYILQELYWTEGSAAGFSYPVPNLRNQVHNANLLGASLLCRVHKHTGESRLLNAAFCVVRHAAAKQRPDGSWPYGEEPTQRWIDNFHTGYNLCALQSIGRDTRSTEFDSSVRRGFEFYRTHFFQEDAAPAYFNDRRYPIDIHSVAQSIITLVSLKHLDAGNVSLAQRVFEWTLNHMWDERGFFYYRVLPWCTIKTSYMRWAQAWMFLAMATLLDSGAATPPSREIQAVRVLTATR